MSKYMKFAREKVRETLDALHMTDLYYSINISFSNRMTRAAGCAECIMQPSGEATDLRIKFSNKLFDRMTMEEKVNTIIHETCHIVCYFLDGDNGKGHKKNWKDAMKKAGVSNPNRCHNVNRDGLRRKQKRYRAACDCRDNIELSGIRRKRILNHGYVYRCVKCNGKIRLSE